MASFERPNLTELEQRIYAAMGTVETPEFQQMLTELSAQSPAYLASHYAMEHTHPSASKVMGCRRELWYRATETERESGIPPAWTKRAAVGILMEPFWMAVLNMAGVPCSRPDSGVAIGPHMRGHADVYIGDNALGEFKDKNGWMYKRLIEGEGLREVLPGEYTQIQLYLHGYDRDWCLYLATPDSPSMLNSMMRDYKRYKEIPNWELPLVYLEIIERNPAEALAAIDRAEMLVADLKSEVVAPREYDGQVRKGMYPCNICSYRNRCNTEAQ